MADEFCLKMPDFHVTFRDLLHAVNLRHGTNGFTSLPKEGVLRIFSPWKIRRLRPGLNPRTWVPKAKSYGDNTSGFFFFFFWDLPVARISPERVTSPEQGKSTGRISTFSLWTGMVWDDISFILIKQSYRGDSVVITSFVRTRYTTRKRGWLLCRRSYSIMHYPIVTIKL